MSIVPRVSVVLPTHNRAKLVGRAISSVLAQSFSSLELIVVDDCSSDNTREVVASFSDPRVRYIRLETNQYVCRARNVGINSAQGEFLAFQDDDDIWLWDKLELQVAALDDDQECGLNLCGYFSIHDNRADLVVGQERFEQMDFEKGPMVGFALIATPAWLVRKKFIDQVGGFDPQMRVRNDWELAYRLSKVCRFSHLPAPLFFQDHKGGGSLWNNHSQVGPAMRHFLYKNERELSAKPKVYGALQTLAANYFVFYGEPQEARIHLQAALSSNPKNWRAWALWLVMLMGPKGVSFAMAVKEWRKKHG